MDATLKENNLKAKSYFRQDDRIKQDLKKRICHSRRR
jgi:hypothetical protein